MSDFKSSLLRVMDQKDHWAWGVLGGSTSTLDQLKVHFQQEFGVYVRDFPVFLSRIHSRCPVADVRRDLAENLYEEETGGLSGTGPHPDMFLYMMEGLGFDRREFRNVKLLEAARAYRDWLDEATTQLPWVASAAVAIIFVEGSVHDRREIAGPVAASPAGPSALAQEEIERALIRDNPLVRFHGLDPRYLKLKRAHARVESGHRHSAWRIVLDNARSAGDRMICVEAVERSLELWIAYRDAVAAAAGISRDARHRMRSTGRG